MSVIEKILKRTKPLTNAELEAMIRSEYGGFKENASSDDPESAHRGRSLLHEGNAPEAASPHASAASPARC